MSALSAVTGDPAPQSAKINSVSIHQNPTPHKTCARRRLPHDHGPTHAKLPHRLEGQRLPSTHSLNVAYSVVAPCIPIIIVSCICATDWPTAAVAVWSHAPATTASGRDVAAAGTNGNPDTASDDERPTATTIYSRYLPCTTGAIRDLSGATSTNGNVSCSTGTDGSSVGGPAVAYAGSDRSTISGRTVCAVRIWKPCADDKIWCAWYHWCHRILPNWASLHAR